MFPLIQYNDKAVDIERFRTLHRRLLRTQQQLSPSNSKADDDDGRKRKISANWRQKQQQAQTDKLQHNVHCPHSAGIEMLAGFNAFSYLTSPEAFYEEPCAAVCNETQNMADVAKQVASMGFHCTSMWQQTAEPAAHYMKW